jgi:hypothetical protein
MEGKVKTKAQKNLEFGQGEILCQALLLTLSLGQ